MEIVCPKCHYQRLTDDRTHPGICPQCGIAYDKYRAPDSDDSSSDSQTLHNSFPAEVPVTFWSRLWSTLSHVPDETDSAKFWGRAMLLAVFIIWGISFMAGGISWENIGGSFLHNINLPFHEFGHVLFGVFGRFMSILGGSLFQIIFPLVFVFAFSFQMRDNFAASICLWWCGQNFIDVSPYIADAPYRAIPLIRGLGESAHDWGNLLTMTNSLESAHSLAKTSFALGCLIMLLSYVWGGYILWQMKKILNDP